MKFNRLRALTATVMLTAALSGCGKTVGSASSQEAQEVIAPNGAETSVADTSVAEEEASASSTETATETQTEASTEISTEAEATDANVEAPTSVAPVVQNTDIYKEFTFTDAYNSFLSETVFVGDSVCSGLRVYKVLPSEKVVAKGSVSANNIFTFNFDVNGAEMPIINALKAVNPKYIVFSMGMNDVNLTSSDVFVENYTKLLTQAQEALPDTKLIVASVTPLAATSNFCSNSQLDLYNDALRASLESSGKWYYADVATGLKDSSNSLKKEYNGGDGIHLSGAAYYAYLYQICRRAVDGGIYQ